MLKLKKNAADKPTTKNWYIDKYQRILVQRNILALFTLFSMVGTLIAVITVNNLAPLKSVEPFVIQIDEKTGLTEVVEPISRKALISANEVMDNYFIWQYVRARETYDIPDYRRNVSITQLMSHSKVYSEFLAGISANNPQSPVARLGEQGKRVVENPVITYLSSRTGARVAQVRFQVSESQRGTKPITYQKMATLEFTYTEIKLSREQRFVNPLGFQVLSYRLDDVTGQGS